MIKVVIDTNIIVSAALSPNGNPAKIIAKKEMQIYYSMDILAEYKEVLSRPRLNIASRIQARIINAITKSGILIEPAASFIPLPDETDRIFYDAAQASGAILITGNTRHYPEEDFIMAPSKFLDLFKNE